MIILGICDTYYQLITFIRIRQTLFKDDTIDLLLSDHSNGADEIVKTLSAKGIFRNVTLLKSKRLVYEKNKSKFETIKEIINGVNGKSIICKAIESNAIYDSMIFYHADICSATIYAYLYKRNPQIKCARLEEGLVSYFTEYIQNPDLSPNGRLKLIYQIRRMLKKSNISENNSIFYCFHPEMYSGKMKPVRIPLFNPRDENTKKLLRDIFHVKEETLDYPQKYIYFAGIGDIEGGNPIGEVKIAKQIAELVGYDNFLVKVHPRDKSGNFSRAGLTVDKSSSVPWEIIQLNYDFSNHVFLTSISGSVLSINLLLKNGPKTKFLYPLCDLSKNNIAYTSVRITEHILNSINRKSSNQFAIIHDLKEIIEK